MKNSSAELGLLVVPDSDVVEAGAENQQPVVESPEAGGGEVLDGTRGVARDGIRTILNMDIGDGVLALLERGREVGDMDAVELARGVYSKSRDFLQSLPGRTQDAHHRFQEFATELGKIPSEKRDYAAAASRYINDALKACITSDQISQTFNKGTLNRVFETLDGIIESQKRLRGLQDGLKTEERQRKMFESLSDEKKGRIDADNISDFGLAKGSLEVQRLLEEDAPETSLEDARKIKESISGTQEHYDRYAAVGRDYDTNIQAFETGIAETLAQLESDIELLGTQVSTLQDKLVQRFWTKDKETGQAKGAFVPTPAPSFDGKIVSLYNGWKDSRAEAKAKKAKEKSDGNAANGSGAFSNFLMASAVQAAMTPNLDGTPGSSFAHKNPNSALLALRNIKSVNLGSN